MAKRSARTLRMRAKLQCIYFICSTIHTHNKYTRRCSLVTAVFARHSGSNYSDHSPLHFLLHVQCQSIPLSSSPSNSKCTKIVLSNISPWDFENYHNLLSKNLPTFPLEVVNCSNVDCKVHYEVIVSFIQLFVSTLLSCSFQCFPCSTPSSPCKLAG